MFITGEVAMGFWVFAGAGLLALVVVRFADRMARRRGLIVRPRLFGKCDRKVTYIGGLVVAAVGWVSYLAGARGISFAALAGATALLFVGLVDDLRSSTDGLSPLSRLVLQAGVGLGTFALGFRPFSTGRPLLDAALVTFFLMASANSFNLIDNMDGVAGMTALGSCLGIAFVAGVGGRTSLVLFALSIAGASLGFLRRNLVGATVYLGNGGSSFLGFLVGALALETGLGQGEVAAALTPFALMVVPFTDTAARQISRWTSGKRAWNIKGGTDHLSHRLAFSGVPVPIVAALHGAGALAAGLVVAAALRGSSLHVLGAVVAAGICVGAGVCLGRHRRPDQRPVRRATALVSLGLLSLVALSSGPALAAGGEALQARKFLKIGVRAGRSLDLANAESAFRSAEKHSRQASELLESKLMSPASLLPFARQTVSQARAMAEATGGLSSAAARSANATAALGIGSNFLAESKIDLKPWPGATTQFSRSARQARSAVKRVDAADFVLPSLIEPVTKRFLKSGWAAVEQFNSAAEAAEVVPKLLGGEGHRTWFLAVQNGAELRATGGFIGAFGILSAHDGRMMLESLEPDGRLPLLPEPVASNQMPKRYDIFESRRLWQNVNMTPDFPTAAATMAQMWEQATGRRIDGVAAVDVIALARLLKATGPVQIAALPQPATADNLVPLLLKDAYSNLPVRDQRQQLLADVGRRSWEKLTSGLGSRAGAAAEGLGRSLAGKHLMIWSRAEEKVLKGIGVSGELKSVSSKGDHLLVVGQNAAASKMDFYARRRVAYKVKIAANGRVDAKLAITLSNRATLGGVPDYVQGPKILDGFNRTYLSAYLSPGMQVESVRIDGRTSEIESDIEKGLTVASRLLETGPQASSRVEMDLSKDGAIAVRKDGSGEYRLFLRQQAGLFPDLVDVSIELPEGVSVTNASPSLAEKKGVLHWRGYLHADRELAVGYKSSLGDRLMAQFSQIME